jgi:hypothetical protein
LVAPFFPSLRGIYQIPELAGNHTKSFTDKAAFEAFRFTILLPLGANMAAGARGKPRLNSVESA